MKTSKWYFEIRNNNHSQFTFKEKEERERNKTKQNKTILLYFLLMEFGLYSAVKVQ